MSNIPEKIGCWYSDKVDEKGNRSINFRMPEGAHFPEGANAMLFVNTFKKEGTKSPDFNLKFYPSKKQNIPAAVKAEDSENNLPF